LKNKAEVRTDCWPCATKRTFKKEKEGAPPSVGTSAAVDTTKPKGLILKDSPMGTPAAFGDFAWALPTLPPDFEQVLAGVRVTSYFLQLPSPLLAPSVPPANAPKVENLGTAINFFGGAGTVPTVPQGGFSFGFGGAGTVPATNTTSGTFAFSFGAAVSK
jgi:hypothetical protein